MACLRYRKQCMSQCRIVDVRDRPVRSVQCTFDPTALDVSRFDPAFRMLTQLVRHPNPLFTAVAHPLFQRVAWARPTWFSVVCRVRRVLGTAWVFRACVMVARRWPCPSLPVPGTHAAPIRMRSGRYSIVVAPAQIPALTEILFCSAAGVKKNLIGAHGNIRTFILGMKVRLGVLGGGVGYAGPDARDAPRAAGYVARLRTRMVTN